MHLSPVFMIKRYSCLSFFPHPSVRLARTAKPSSLLSSHKANRSGESSFSICCWWGGIKEDWFLQCHRCRCLPLWPASSASSFSLRSGEKRGPLSFVHSDDALKTVILETKFRGRSKSVFIWSRPDSNRDSPHCGQTSNQVIICLFSCTDCCKSPVLLNTAEKKETDCCWFDFHLCGRLPP